MPHATTTLHVMGLAAKAEIPVGRWDIPHIDMISRLDAFFVQSRKVEQENAERLLLRAVVKTAATGRIALRFKIMRRNP